MRTFILTEKPSVARDFAQALGVTQKRQGYLENQHFIITWAIGHLVELYEPQDYDPKWSTWQFDRLPVIPKQFLTKPIPKTQSQLQCILELLSRESYEKIIIATDAGREGELIARSILLRSPVIQQLGISSNIIFRFWTSQALTPKVIKEGMTSLSLATNYERLYKAGKSRQMADWLVGMNCTRAASIKMKDLFSIGRVQTAILALIVNRCLEREQFQPKPYWLLYAVFENPKGKWKGIWFRADKTHFDTQLDAETVKNSVHASNARVIQVESKKKSVPPPLLYSLTDLQQDANNRYGYSAKQTLEIAQQLYEEKKCLSYPRTDATVLGEKNVDMVKELIEKFTRTYPEVFKGIDEHLISLSNKRVFNDAKLTDHHALIPLAPLDSKATIQEKNIFTLVLNRFAAAFYPDYIYIQTVVITLANESETFKSTGRVILALGWKVLYPQDQSEKKKKAKKASGKQKDAEDEDTDESAQTELPPLVKNDPCVVIDTSIQEKKTTPPPAYTDALILKDMTNPGRYVTEDVLKKIYKGEIGLGTQATRAQILETLIQRNYIERQKKQLVATQKGCDLIASLQKLPISGMLASPEETARWEMQLDRIARGEIDETQFIEAIKTFVTQSISEFRQAFIQDRIGQCPNCHGSVIETEKAFGCSNWRTQDGGCRFVIWKTIAGKPITKDMARQLLTDKSIGPLHGFMSKAKKEFSAILKLEQHETGYRVSFEFSSHHNLTVK
ncbi:MAG: DNA topoisomerase 3 [Desulfobacterales bacterium]|nr:DNA topoisomerase 3 [Desulfobacterales bacterium]